MDDGRIYVFFHTKKNRTLQNVLKRIFFQTFQKSRPIKLDSSQGHTIHRSTIRSARLIIINICCLFPPTWTLGVLNAVFIDLFDIRLCDFLFICLGEVKIIQRRDIRTGEKLWNESEWFFNGISSISFDSKIKWMILKKEDRIARNRGHFYALPWNP